MSIPQKAPPEHLFRALLTLRSDEECAAFLEDLLTPSELADLVHRMEVVVQLWQKRTYEEIQASTGASSTTIARVRRSLEHGPGGYRTVLERMFEET